MPVNACSVTVTLTLRPSPAFTFSFEAVTATAPDPGEEWQPVHPDGSLSPSPVPLENPKISDAEASRTTVAARTPSTTLAFLFFMLDPSHTNTRAFPHSFSEGL